jgi:hypothetical protein
MNFTQLGSRSSSHILITHGVKDVDLRIDGRHITKIVAISIRGTAKDDIPTWINNVLADINTAIVTWVNSDGILHEVRVPHTIPYDVRNPNPPIQNVDRRALPLGHAGLIGVYETLRRDILPQALGNNYILNSSTAYWISGHSLGGGLAELMALDLIQRGVPAENIICFNIGGIMPAHYTMEETAKSTRASERIFFLYNNQDKVTIDTEHTLGVSARLVTNEWLNSMSGYRVGFNCGKTFLGHNLDDVYIPYIAKQALN